MLNTPMSFSIGGRPLLKLNRRILRIGMVIADLREATGMTQQDIADKLGITQPRRFIGY